MRASLFRCDVFPSPNHPPPVVLACDQISWWQGVCRQSQPLQEAHGYPLHADHNDLHVLERCHFNVHGNYSLSWWSLSIAAARVGSASGPGRQEAKRGVEY